MEDFLKELFGDDLTPEQRVAVFTTPDLHTRFFSDAAEVARYADQQSKTQDVYFGVGLIRGTPTGRGKLQHVAGIGALWCDIDVSGEGHQKQNLPQSTEEAQSILSEMPLAPSIVVHSGHGLHAYWLLQEPWIFAGDDDRQQAASLAKRWHGKVCQVASGRGWALENLGDLTRVLRLPDTLNHKGAGNPAEVRILQCDPTRRYAADDFTPYLPPETVATEADHTPPGPILLHAGAEPPAGKLVDAVSQSPLFLQSWNRQRTDLPDQSQSGYDLSLATLAALRGWDDQEIANLIIAVRRCHRQNPAKSLREDYVRRTISKAREVAVHGGGEGSDVDLTAMLGAQATAGDPTKPQAVARRLCDVEREMLQWLWPGRIPLGKLTLLAGDPGLGKSLVSLDIAARVSRGGAWPDTPLLSQSVGSVVLFNAEDDLADTIAPRLDSAEADDSKIIAVEGVELRDPKSDESQKWYFSLENDLPRLEELIVENPDTRLVVIDPISAYCGSIDSHKNADVRSLLAPLAELAGRYRIAVVAVTHLSKSGGAKAVYRAMGSLAFAAASRAVWSVVKDQADSTRRLFLPAKLNLAQDPDGLAYRITKGRVEWDDQPVKMHADDAFAAELATAESKGRGSERREACEWLRDSLRHGPMLSSEIAEVGKELGFTARTLQRAFKELGGTPRKESFDGPWLWGLPGQDDNEDAKTTPSLLTGTLGRTGAFAHMGGAPKMPVRSQDAT